MKIYFVYYFTLICFIHYTKDTIRIILTSSHRQKHAYMLTILQKLNVFDYCLKRCNRNMNTAMCIEICIMVINFKKVMLIWVKKLRNSI